MGEPDELIMLSNTTTTSVESSLSFLLLSESPVFEPTASSSLFEFDGANGDEWMIVKLLLSSVATIFRGSSSAVNYDDRVQLLLLAFVQIFVNITCTV
jgi:hypothetical protein